jgi:hypothetical protein
MTTSLKGRSWPFLACSISAKYERELVDTDLSVVVLMLDQMVCVDAPVIDVGSMPLMVGRQPCRQWRIDNRRLVARGRARR